jgi:hypothetical protein
LRIEQEFPGFGQDDKFTAFITVKNFCNLLNNEWCVLQEAGFPRAQSVVDMEIVDGQYLYERFIVPQGQARVVDASLWEIRIGASYYF